MTNEPPELSTTDARPASASVTLDCRDPIGELTEPPADYEVIGDAVALLTSSSHPTALQTGLNDGSDRPLRLFAKTGLLVRTGVESEIIVPEEWADRVLVGWGNTERKQRSTHLDIGPCAGRTPWIAFPGGYYVSDPSCVEIVVRTASQDHRVTVGVGAPCPGQSPPPEPTAT
jgi:hypothetical protein